jgi:hypothetical protein
MSKRITFYVPDEWYEFFRGESERTNISVGELIRRPLSRAYPLTARRRTTGIEINFSVWRRRIFGFRSGVAFDPRR